MNNKTTIQKTLVCSKVKRQDTYTPPGKDVTYYMFDIEFDGYKPEKPLYFLLTRYTADQDLPFKAGTMYNVEIIEKEGGKKMQVKKLGEASGTKSDKSVGIDTNYRINHMVARESAIRLLELIPGMHKDISINDVMDEMTYHLFQMIMSNPRKYDNGQTTCNALKMAINIVLQLKNEFNNDTNNILTFVESQFLRILDKYDNVVINPYEA
jgi:hypothetical protein